MFSSYVYRVPVSVYHAVYLEYLTLKHLKEKLAACFSISPEQILEIHVQGPSGIHILVTDNVS